MMGPKEMLAHKAGAAFAARADDEPVPSPCISVCRMTPDRSHCEGCFRTIDEIRAAAGLVTGPTQIVEITGARHDLGSKTLDVPMLAVAAAVIFMA